MHHTDQTQQRAAPWSLVGGLMDPQFLRGAADDFNGQHAQAVPAPVCDTRWQRAMQALSGFFTRH